MTYDTCAKRREYIRNAFDVTTEHLPCALCGNDKNDVLITNEEVKVLICTKCSLAYLSPRLTQDGYERFYREYFMNARRSLHTYDDAVARLIKKGGYKYKMPLVNTFRNWITADGHGLEIGGGWGTLAHALEAELKCTVDVVEPSPLAAEVARKYYRLNTYNQNGEIFLSSTAGVKTYDFLLLVHVFEHIVDPNKFLRLISQVLSPGGKLLIALPNLSRPDEPSDRYFHIEHCFYYSPKTIDLMLGKHGFHTLEIKQDSHDMKVAAVYTGQMIDDFENNEKKVIKVLLWRIDARYKYLRRLKHLSKNILPRVLFSHLLKLALLLKR